MVYVSYGSVFTSYKALLVREWMSTLASLGKTLGMGIFLRLLYIHINRKKIKTISCPRSKFETQQTRDFCQNYGTLSVFRAVVAD